MDCHVSTDATPRFAIDENRLGSFGLIVHFNGNGRYGDDHHGATSNIMKNRLKVLRAERDWTQADLAERLNVSRQTINALEKGKYDPSLPLAFKIARLFSLTIEEIFQEE